MEKNLLNNNDEITLRPKKIDDFIGQEMLKKKFKIFIGAAKKREEVLDHVLLYGPPGLGKTTLAYIIANEMNAKIKIVNGSNIEHIGDLAGILSNVEIGDILFIDEIHRLPKNIEEIFYSVMEDFKFTIINTNNYENNANINFDLPPFTLIGATTRIGMISLPLKTRFGIIEKFNFYTEKELEQIIFRTSKIFKTKINNNVAKIIASRSRGTPRIANRLFKRIRDFANFNNNNEITDKLALEALKILKINDLGLNDIDFQYLKTVIRRFNGGPIGLKSIANAIGEEIINLENDYEPYLIQLGLINRTVKGRVATKKAFEYLRNCSIV